jgi:hypothetical protein
MLHMARSIGSGSMLGLLVLLSSPLLSTSLLPLSPVPWSVIPDLSTAPSTLDSPPIGCTCVTTSRYVAAAAPYIALYFTLVTGAPAQTRMFSAVHARNMTAHACATCTRECATPTAAAIQRFVQYFSLSFDVGTLVSPAMAPCSAPLRRCLGSVHWEHASLKALPILH